MNKSSYKILGVDPGTNVLGYAILEVEGKKLTMISMGVIHLKKIQDHHKKLKEIFLNLQEIIETYLPKILAVESPFYGKNVQSMLKLGRAQGVAMAAGITMGLDIVEYAPKKIKLSLTGNGNASKEQVAAMVSHLLKIKIDPKHTLDATDALATAICHYNQNQGLANNQKKYKDWSGFIKSNPDRKTKK